MFLLNSPRKKFIGCAGFMTLVAFFTFPMLQAQADNSEAYLKKIMENTYGTLQAVENLPTTLNELYKLAASWLSQTQPDSINQLQTDLGKVGALALNNFNMQTSLQPGLLSALFSEATPEKLPYANDLAFQSLLGMPLFPQDPRNKNNANPSVNPKQNYIKNASGLTIKHYMPERAMNGDPFDIERYRSYYNAVMAVESFNAYILSGLYSDYYVQDDPNSANPQDRIKSLTSLQNSLITQATSSDWFLQVTKSELGLVFRQLLIYESQIFVLMTQLIQVQKQLLATQAMTNTLQIAGNIANEKTLLDRANKRMPSQ